MVNADQVDIVKVDQVDMVNSDLVYIDQVNANVSLTWLIFTNTDFNS